MINLGTGYGRNIANIDEIEWKGVLIKYCEFKRAYKDFVNMERSDMEYTVKDLPLGCVFKKDRDIIIRTMLPAAGKNSMHNIALEEKD